MKRRAVFIAGTVSLVLVIVALVGAGQSELWPGAGGRGDLSINAPVARGEDVFVPPPPYIHAAAAVLIDGESGRLLYSKNGFERVTPGSLTKVVAAYTALQRGTLTDEVRVATTVSSGLTFGFHEGEQFSLDDLLRMMLFRPEHDPGVAVAFHIAGSIDAFARQMDAQARRLGATASHFADPNGADGDPSYSTAFDLGWIARHALEDERFAQIVKMPRTRISRRGHNRTIFNINSFLMRRSDATGIKTAFTAGRGYSLIGSVQRNGRRLIVVTLESPTAEERFHDAMSLLDYGLAHFDVLKRNPRIPMTFYEVREGDTLTGLASRFGVPVTAILIVNSIENPDTLRSGQVLSIPR